MHRAPAISSPARAGVNNSESGVLVATGPAPPRPWSPLCTQWHAASALPAGVRVASVAGAAGAPCQCGRSGSVEFRGSSQRARVPVPSQRSSYRPASRPNSQSRASNADNELKSATGSVSDDGPISLHLEHRFNRVGKSDSHLLVSCVDVPRCVVFCLMLAH